MEHTKMLTQLENHHIYFICSKQKSTVFLNTYKIANIYYYLKKLNKVSLPYRIGSSIQFGI